MTLSYSYISFLLRIILNMKLCGNSIEKANCVINVTKIIKKKKNDQTSVTCSFGRCGVVHLTKLVTFKLDLLMVCVFVSIQVEVRSIDSYGNTISACLTFCSVSWFVVMPHASLFITFRTITVIMTQQQQWEIFGRKF